MATEPEEMKCMIEGCKNVYQAMGGTERIICEQELVQKQKMRRSIIAVKDIMAGEKIAEDMLGAKRPATGVPLEKMDEMIGKTVNRDIKADTVIFQEDIVW